MADNSFVHDRIVAHDYLATNLISEERKATNAGQSPESADGD